MGLAPEYAEFPLSDELLLLIDGRCRHRMRVQWSGTMMTFPRRNRKRRV
jgi:hypothetical protein